MHWADIHYRANTLAIVQSTLVAMSASQGLIDAELFIPLGLGKIAPGWTSPCLKIVTKGPANGHSGTDLRNMVQTVKYVTLSRPTGIFGW